MNDRCWYCGGRLIWQCDYDYAGVTGEDADGIITYLTCSECGAEVEYRKVEEYDE